MRGLGRRQTVAGDSGGRDGESGDRHSCSTGFVPPGEYLPLGAPTCANRRTAGESRLLSRRRLTGIGASGGTATGPAAVLGDVRDATRLGGGDVLMTRQTDPGWAPLFGLVSGLVIERGGLLSHGAIVAREFGLPCVVGVFPSTIPLGIRCWTCRSSDSMDGDASRA